MTEPHLRSVSDSPRGKLVNGSLYEGENMTPRGLEPPQLAYTANAQVIALQKQVATLQEQLRASESKIAMWEECIQQLVYCLLLSPDMNEVYKTECVDLLREVSSPSVVLASNATSHACVWCPARHCRPSNRLRKFITLSVHSHQCLPRWTPISPSTQTYVLSTTCCC